MKKTYKTVNDSLAIIVLSFDGYKDVWPYFFEAFNKYWSDCEYPIYLVNNEAKVEYKNIHVIHTGKEVNWCDRARKAIQQIDSEYILLLLEDYLIGTEVENKNIEQVLNFIDNNDVKYFRLTNIPHLRSKMKNNNNIYPIFKNEEYGINLQASIWKKQYLLTSLNNVDGSAWEFEIDFLKRAVNEKDEPFCDCFVSTANVMDIHNGILKGKWFPNTIRYFRKRGINIDYINRGKLSFREVIVYNTRFQLRERMPYGLRKKIKKVLIKFGLKFVSDN